MVSSLFRVFKWIMSHPRMYQYRIQTDCDPRAFISADQKLERLQQRAVIVTKCYQDEYIAYQRRFRGSYCLGSTEELKAVLSPNRCCFVLLLVSASVTGLRKPALLFLRWLPETAKLEDKMIHASIAERARKRLFRPTENMFSAAVALDDISYLDSYIRDRFQRDKEDERRTLK